MTEHELPSHNDLEHIQHPPENSSPKAGTDLEAIYERIGELEQAGGKRPPEFFLLLLKRRTLEKLERRKQWHESVTIDEVDRELARIKYEAGKAGTEAAQHATHNLDWAFMTLVAHHDPGFLRDNEIYTEQLIRDYNDMQRAYAATGGVRRGIELTPDLTETLSWMLEQVALPHDLGTIGICIPFAPLEQQLRLASHASSLNYPFPQWVDHEGKTDVGGLMETWHQTEDTQDSA